MNIVIETWNFPARDQGIDFYHESMLGNKRKSIARNIHMLLRFIISQNYFFPSVELGQVVIGIPEVVASYRVYPVSEIGR